MNPHDMTLPPPDVCRNLETIRDWLRYAVSQFEAARLTYGHGTSSAVDEAAYLILSTLHLPPDGLDQWIDCRLTSAERQSILEIVTERVTTRKPAPYLTGSAWIQGHKFAVDERTIVPRSYIGELLCKDGLGSVVQEASTVNSVLDLCTGSGCLAILAALSFPNATVVAADLSDDALDVARLNVEAYGLSGRILLVKSDLFAALSGTRYDLIISNPPYVPSSMVAEFPLEYRAEPAMAHDGGVDGMSLVRRILEAARTHLTASGTVVAEVGQARGLLETEFPNLPFLWLDTETSEGEVLSLTAADLQRTTRSATRTRKNKTDRG